MIWAVLKPHYWILDRKFRSANRYLIILVITLLLFAGQWLYETVLRDASRVLDSDTTLSLLLLVGLIGSVLFLLLNTSTVLRQLFETREVEILTVNPIPQYTIYAVKLLQSSLALLPSGLFLTIVLILAGISREASLLFYPLILITLMGNLISIAAVVLGLILLISRIIASKQLENGLFLIYTMLPLLFLLLQSDITAWFSTQTELHSVLIAQVMNPLPLFMVTIVFTVLSVVGSFHVFINTFQEGRTRYQVVRPSKKPRRTPSTNWLVKEWTTVRRDVRLLVGFTQPFVFIILLLLPQLQGGEISLGLCVLMFWFALALAAQNIIMMTSLAVELLMREGSNIALVCTQPIHAGAILKTKFWAAWLPQVLVWGLCTVLLTVIYSFTVWQAILIWMTFAFGVMGAKASSLGLAAIYADFRLQTIPIGIRFVHLGINALWALISIIITAWSIWYLFPNHNISSVFTSLHIDFTSRLWLFTPILFLGLLSLAILLWQRGTHHLSHWETLT